MSKTSKRAISTLVITILLISTIAVIVPLSYADHTSTATVAFTAGESKRILEDSSLDVVVTNDAASTDSITIVRITFPGAGFTGIDTLTQVPPTGWLVDTVTASYIEYDTAGAGIAADASETFTVSVTNPGVDGVADNPTVDTTDDDVTSGTSVGAGITPPIVITASDNQFSISVDGAAAVECTIPVASYDPLTTLVIAIDALITGATASWDTDHIVFTSGTTGPTSTIAITAGTADATTLIGFASPTETPGGAPDPKVDSSTVTGTLTIFVESTSDFTIDYVELEHANYVDYADVLTVVGSGVTAGSEVIVYWDYPTGTYIHPLNNTEGNRDGTFDLEVKVPSDVVGDHYLWIKNVATAEIISHGPITMEPKIKLSPSSGLKNDDITIKGYGFADDSEITFTYEKITDILSDDTGKDETDDLGYFEYTFEVDTDLDDYYDVTAMDEKFNEAVATFKLGAAISLNIDEGPTGTVVTIEGRGWTWPETITFREETSSMPIEVVGDVVNVGSTGRFSAEVVIPEFGSEGDYDIEAVESDTGYTSSDSFELTGLPEIVVTPTYGTPGSIITVKGYNFTQIVDTEVEIYLDTATTTELVIAKTNSDGTFEDTFISPAVVFATHDVVATDEYDLVAIDPFKVGLIALIINPVYGEAGTELFITGIGFADGDYNVTFGIELYEEYGDGVDDEAISDYFFVPNVVPGPYDIIISDEDGNEMTVEFRVTAVTEVTLDPAMAPNKYNVTIEGYNFADKEDTVDFVLYNATDEWDMNVRQGSPVGTPVKTCDDGNFTAWWEVLDEDTLSLGDYTINVTGYNDFFVQIPFSVVEARVSVAPRKPLFDRGDTIQFDVKNDFDFKTSYMKIWDPDDNLYWETQKFALWTKARDIYTVPYYMQTSNMNPMELSQDAPLGEWFWVFYETGTTQLTNGTFEVGPSAESLITEQIQALSEELGIDIDTLQTYIDAKIVDLDDTVSTMAANIATAISGMEDDLDDAVTGMQDDIDDMGTKMDSMGTKMNSIETMVDSITATSGDAQAAANEAAASADAALDAAEANQQQTSGLTTLVYGAIGASLIAALAAIVSLMQISRRIAG